VSAVLLVQVFVRHNQGSLQNEGSLVEVVEPRGELQVKKDQVRAAFFLLMHVSLAVPSDVGSAFMPVLLGDFVLLDRA